MTNKELKKEQMNEAIKRMKKIGFIENVLNDFRKGVINKSEHVGFPGILYWLDDTEKEFIKDWENKTGNLVYHVIKDNTEFGIMYSFLYISKYEEEWEMDIMDLGEERAVAYCGIGLDDSYYEYGAIGILPVNGGLQRNW